MPPGAAASRAKMKAATAGTVLVPHLYMQDGHSSSELISVLQSLMRCPCCTCDGSFFRNPSREEDPHQAEWADRHAFLATGTKKWAHSYTIENTFYDTGSSLRSIESSC